MSSKFRILSNLLFTLILTSTHFAYAANSLSASKKVDLELKMQEKARSILRPIDPYAQVLARITLKRYSTILPGLDEKVTNYETPTNSEAIDFDDVERVEIQVLTRMETVPASVKRMVEDSIDASFGAKRLTFARFDGETLARITELESQKTEPLLKLGQNFEKIRGDFVSEIPKYSTYLLAFGIFIGVMGIALLFGLRMVRSAIRDGLVRLATAVSEQTLKAPLESSRPSNMIDVGPKALSSSPLSLNSESSARELLASFSNETIAAFMADCYWCEKDNYAAWLWKNISSDLRVLLEKLSFGNRYAVNLLDLEPEDASLLLAHPYYLKPTAINEVSQKDVLKNLVSQPALFQRLSPLRKTNLRIDLTQRVALLAVPQISTSTSRLIPLQASLEYRDLPQASDQMTLTNEDDLILMQNPAMVPHNQRKLFPSLVWITLLSAENQTEFFKTRSANDIARIWCGPDTLLNQIEKTIGDRKMKIVLDFVNQRSPSRVSGDFIAAVLEVLDLLHQERKTALSDDKSALKNDVGRANAA